MDQDASNNPGKPSWREKLGLGSGSKEMPKISNEFKAARTDLKGEPAAEKTRSPQPVTKPAPMAPRSQPVAQPLRSPAMSVSSSNPLADRLKAQRQAAEKLAEQRISAARSSAGGEPRARREAAPEKPRFTFADEELAQAKRETPADTKREFQSSFPPKQPQANGNAKTSPINAPVTNQPLVPPRPALGGERPINPVPSEARQPLPQLSQRFQSPPPQPSGYRSIDPPGYQPPPQPQQPPRRGPAAQRGPAYQQSYGNGGYPEGAGAPRGYEGYRRRPSQEPQNAEENHYSPRQRRSAAMPARGRQPAHYDEDMGEVFEEDAPASRRRASAQDYHQAYREYDERYEPEQRRRSSGPWLIALVLFLVAIAATAGWYYFYVMKPNQSALGEVPVIAAPEKPAKTEPEPLQPNGSTLGASSTQGALESSPDRRKQIYDRVLGEESVEGNQIVPTQEPPQQIEPSGDQTQQQQMQNSQPAPKASDEGAGTMSNESVDPLPLPLPPPPGSGTGQQGNLNSSTTSATVSANMPNEDAQTFAEPTAASEVIAPVPGENKKPEKVAAEASPPEAVRPVEKAEVKPIEPPAETAVTAPVKPKAQAIQPKKTASVEAEKIETPEPIVLTPSQDAQASGETGTLPDSVNQNPEKQSGSFFNFGNTGKKRLTGKRAEQPDFSNSNLINAGPKPLSVDATDPNQVAAISPDDQTQPLPMPAPQESEPKAQSTGSGGYVAQLASFRSEAEAMAEYDRLRTKYSDVVSGLAPRVTKASVSGATRYRLGVGPVASREAASRICNSLIAAGERDCLVRGN